MRIALIPDQITQSVLSLENELAIKNIMSLNYRYVSKFWKPLFLFVEFAWQGYKNKWKFKIASYLDHPKRNNHQLIKYDKKLNIPIVFRNKKDGVHFDRFISSAKIFDHIFAVDENYINKYKVVVPKETTVNMLIFAAQSKIQNYCDQDYKYEIVNLFGSYSRHIHLQRKQFEDSIFSILKQMDIAVDVYDRKLEIYKYSEYENMTVNNSVWHADTTKIYKNYAIFKEYCHAAKAGADYALKHYIWSNRLEQIRDTIGI